MRLIVTSDTHGRKDLLEGIVKRMRDDDILIHLGDLVRDLDHIRPVLEERNIRFYSVRGNCDVLNMDTSPYIQADICGYSIGMTHGHREGVKYSLLKLGLFADERRLDLLLYGHTHVPRTDYSNRGCILFNPGSLGAQHQGEPTFGTVEFRENGIFTWVNYYSELEKVL
ncbi:MAG: YfcE family phosphodiesterase [Clostridia bacterium]|jgi:putative phosphoesterase|nr:YfcE family phosphodiesterase [Clostridia bacterium]